MIDKTGSTHAQLVMDQIKAYQGRVNQTREPEAAIAPTEIQKPTFLQVKAPKLGLILGGGGALAYAHIGLLHEFEKQKIPKTFVTKVVKESIKNGKTENHISFCLKRKSG